MNQYKDLGVLKESKFLVSLTQGYQSWSHQINFQTNLGQSSFDPIPFSLIFFVNTNNDHIPILKQTIRTKTVKMAIMAVLE